MRKIWVALGIIVYPVWFQARGDEPMSVRPTAEEITLQDHLGRIRRADVAMSDRPTPEQIAAYEGPTSMSIFRALAHHGYQVIHIDDIDAMGLRIRTLARSRARLTRAAQRLVDACIEDADHPAEYLAALDAMTDLLKHP